MRCDDGVVYFIILNTSVSKTLLTALIAIMQRHFNIKLCIFWYHHIYGECEKGARISLSLSLAVAFTSTSTAYIHVIIRTHAHTHTQMNQTYAWARINWNSAFGASMCHSIHPLYLLMLEHRQSSVESICWELLKCLHRKWNYYSNTILTTHYFTSEISGNPVFHSYSLFIYRATQHVLDEKYQIRA